MASAEQNSISSPDASREFPKAVNGLPSGTRIGHTHLKVADLERSLAFYRDALGFTVTYRDRQLAMLAADGYHHHVGLNTWETRGGSPPPKEATGLHHHAIVLPDRRSLALTVQRVIAAGYCLTGAQDHGVTEAYYFDDPDGNGVELYIDRPRDRWPVRIDGTISPYSLEVELDDLLVELVPAGGVRAEELAGEFRGANARFSGFVDGLSEEQWNVPSSKDSTSIGMAAHHVAASYHTLLMRLQAQSAGGPIRQMAQARLDAPEAPPGDEPTRVSRVQVLGDLRLGAAPLCAAIRSLTDIDLDRPIIESEEGLLIPLEAWVRTVVAGIVDQLADLQEALAARAVVHPLVQSEKVEGSMAMNAQATAVADFDEGFRAFRGAIAGAPDESLGYLKPGDDYALGGLVHHVNAVLEHYLVVLDAIVASDFTETEPRDRPMLFETAAARARTGLAPGERTDALAATARLHREISQRIADLVPQQFERHAPVRFEPAAEFFPTSAADILGWLIKHYQEHVPQVDQLLSSWRGR